MPRFIDGEGDLPNDIFLCGERPGVEEHDARRPFIGRAGEELWSRLWRVCRLRRPEVYVTNLVKTFSTEPPSAEEIKRDSARLREELYDCRPRLIVTIGYHAARWFLPQFAETNGDVFHGLAFEVARPSLRSLGAIVLPVLHSAAALRQPERNQNQFTDDLRAVATIVDLLRQPRSRSVGPVSIPTHRVATTSPYQVGLASVIATTQRPGSVLGLDTEGFRGAPEAISLSSTGVEAALLETGSVSGHERHTPLDPQFVQSAIDAAGTIAIHHAKHDYQTCDELGLTLPAARVDCTMLMAYELGLPQSLKLLMYRLFGRVRSEYDDLIRPLDDERVRLQLEAAHGTYQVRLDKWKYRKAHKEKCERRERKAEREKAKDDDRRAARGTSARAGSVPRVSSRAGDVRAAAREEASAAEGEAAEGDWYEDGQLDVAEVPREAGADARPTDGREAAASGEAGGTPKGIATDSRGSFPTRLVSSLHRLTTTEAEKPLRERWEASTFCGLVELSPPPTWKDLPTTVRVPYALNDAIDHRDLHALLDPMLDQQGVRRAYSIDRGVIPFLARNEQIGLKVDAAQLPILSARFGDEFTAVCAELATIAGHPVNPNASDDVAETLFTELGVRPTKRSRKTGQWTTQKKYLKARELEHRAVPLVILGRHLTKLKGTYTDRLPSMLRDGRYHPDWKYTRTASSRMAEELILLVPKDSDLAPLVRNVFIADDGNRLVSCDLSQIEMRVMAHESRDPVLLDVYARDGDVHADTAYHLLGAPKDRDEQDDALHRKPSKILNFGIIMQMTEYGLLEQLHSHRLFSWDIEKCREFLRDWYRLHKGCREYVSLKQAQARRYGFVTDMWGGKRPLTAIWSEDSYIVAEAERQAAATPIQAGAVRIAKMWVKKVWQQVLLPRIRSGERYCEPWVWVHDDITVECDRRIARDVRREMLALVPDVLCVPTKADAKIGEQWGSMRKAAH